MQNKLNVQNQIQRVAYFAELSGQISDGKWENASPYGHHYFTSLAPEEISINPKNLGFNTNATCSVFGRKHFFTRSMAGMPKRNYNFTDKTLLDIVGERMLTIINIYINSNKDIQNAIENCHHDFPESVEEFVLWTKSTDSYYTSKVTYMKRLGITTETLQFLTTGHLMTGEPGMHVTMKMLKQELTELKKIIQLDQKPN